MSNRTSIDMHLPHSSFRTRHEYELPAPSSPPKGAFGGSPPIRRRVAPSSPPLRQTRFAPSPSHRTAPKLALRSKSESELPQPASWTQTVLERQQRTGPQRRSTAAHDAPSICAGTSSPIAAASTSPPPRLPAPKPYAVDEVSALIDAAACLGKHTTLRIAHEESIRQLKPWKDQWTSEHVRRFKYRPEQPEFTSRALVSLVEQALLGHQRRVDKALGDASRARRYATQAESAGWLRAEEALQTFTDPSAQHAVRQAVRAYSSRADKEAMKLRAALEALEKETAYAQSSHVVAMRVVATRLVAQHDASVATVSRPSRYARWAETLAWYRHFVRLMTESPLNRRLIDPTLHAQVLAELEAAEAWGPLGLQDAERAHHTAQGILVRELSALETSADERVRCELERCKAQHAREVRRHEQEAAILRGSLADEEATAAETRELNSVLAARLASSNTLREELGQARAECAWAKEEMRRLGEQLGATEARAEGAVREAKSSELELQASREREEELQRKNRLLEATEATLNASLAKLKRQSDKERAELTSANSQLTEQNRSLRGRLVTLHATIHGIHERDTTAEERMSWGAEVVESREV